MRNLEAYLKLFQAYKIELFAEKVELTVFAKKAPGIIHLVRTQKFPETNISKPLIRPRTCAYQGVRNIFQNILRTYLMDGPPSKMYNKVLNTTLKVLALFQC